MKRKPSQKKMPLPVLLTMYLTAREADRPINSPLSEKTKQSYRENISVFTRFLCRPATVADLNAETINQFLRHQFTNGKSTYTVKNRRTHLRVLWRFAHKIGLAKPWEGVQDVRVASLNIQGFDQADITKLVEYVSTLRGVVRNTGLPKRMWWETWVLTNWESGVRSGDMFNIAPKDFDRDGWIWIVESKTGKRGWRRLRKSVADLLAAFIDFEDSRERIWPGYKRRHFYRAFGEMATKAGTEGSARWIRRGSASEVDKLYPGTGWKFLKHSVPELFEKHYKVDKITDQKPLLPPEIEAKVFRPEKKTK